MGSIPGVFPDEDRSTPTYAGKAPGSSLLDAHGRGTMQGTRRHARARRRLRRLTVMWSIIGVAVLGVVGFGVGAATGLIPVFQQSHSESAGTPQPVAPSPTLTPLPTPEPQPTTATPSPEPTVPPPPAPPAASPATQECATETTMSVMAHYDDDLIFANPTIANAMAADLCVRTVFVTAGDAGSGMQYATSRESGILSAYDVLRGSDLPWTEEHFTLASGLPVTRFTASDDPSISVTFLRLPDGNIKGDGFEATGWESLARLRTDTISVIHTVDSHAEVSLNLLQASLTELTSAYSPTNVLTLVPNESWASKRDHSDHSAVGSLTRAAAQAAGVPATQLHYATGYGNKDRPANVTGAALDLKLLAFWTYTQYDSVMKCKTPAECLNIKMFGHSLEREYFLTDAEL